MAQPFFSVSVETSPRNLAELWRKMPERLLAAWQKSLYAVVAQQGVKYAKRQFRSAPRGQTTPTATAVRTGNLRANYGVSVSRPEEANEHLGNVRSASIDFGLMRRFYTEQGGVGIAKALGYGYVHEFGATVPSRAVGPGGYERTYGTGKRRVRVAGSRRAFQRRAYSIPPRPAIAPTQEWITPRLMQRLEADAARLLKNPETAGG